MVSPDIISITRYLADHRLTQYQLAQMLSVSPTTLNRWVRGKTRISPVYRRLLRDNGVINNSEGGD